MNGAMDGAVDGALDGEAVTRRGNQRSVESVGAGAGSSADSRSVLGWGVIHGLEPPDVDTVTIPLIAMAGKA